MDQLTLPATASVSLVLGVFLGALLLFHLLLVYWWPLGKTGWKRVDYYWLGVTVLSLVGAAGQVRQFAAAQTIAHADSMLNSTYDLGRSFAMSYARDPGALCRQFVRSESSPPVDEAARLQREFDTACDWIKNLVATLGPVTPTQRLPADALATPASLSDDLVLSSLEDIREALERFNAVVDRREYLINAAEQTGVEIALLFMSPILLSAALALRIAKVTGELRLDRSANQVAGADDSVRVQGSRGPHSPDSMLATQTTCSTTNCIKGCGVVNSGGDLGTVSADSPIQPGHNKQQRASDGADDQ